MLELYLSSKSAYSGGISGVSDIFVVLNNDGDQKKGRIPDPDSARVYLRKWSFSATALAVILMCGFRATVRG